MEAAFDAASAEPKIEDRALPMAQVSMPLSEVPRLLADAGGSKTDPLKGPAEGKKRDVMRKNMTRVVDETLEREKNCVYIGEDVQHGGYYLVTDRLAKKHPNRVCDFPPDETTLVGAGMGYSQAYEPIKSTLLPFPVSTNPTNPLSFPCLSGMLPILEIPYAK